MARPTNKDPLDKFRWQVEIEGFIRLGFTSMEAPGYMITTKKYREGGSHLHPKVIVDSIEYKPITLLRGVTANEDFLEWAQDPFKILESSENSDAQSQVGEYRRNVTISHLDRQGNAVKTYTLINAIPSQFVPASDFSADADDTFSLERLVLEYESFEVFTEETDRNPFSIRGIVKRLTRNVPLPF